MQTLSEPGRARGRRAAGRPALAPALVGSRRLFAAAARQFGFVGTARMVREGTNRTYLLSSCHQLCRFSITIRDDTGHQAGNMLQDGLPLSRTRVDRRLCHRRTSPPSLPPALPPSLAPLLAVPPSLKLPPCLPSCLPASLPPSLPPALRPSLLSRKVLCLIPNSFLHSEMEEGFPRALDLFRPHFGV